MTPPYIHGRARDRFYMNAQRVTTGVFSWAACTVRRCRADVTGNQAASRVQPWHRRRNNNIFFWVEWEIFPAAVTFGQHGSWPHPPPPCLPPQDFSYDDTKVEFNVDAPNGVVMEGYLFKRASNAFKTWNR